MNSLAKSLIKVVLLAIVALVGLLLVNNWFFGHNNEQDWQLKQSMSGEIEIRSTAGYYGHAFNKIWTYPKIVQVIYDAPSKDKGRPTDDRIEITFNDGGTAHLSTLVTFRTPSEMEQCRLFHQTFNGNINSAEDAVWAHLVNVAKATATLMSSTENQTSRKGEYTQLVESQLNDGIYTMRRVEKALHDQFDEKGKPITVWSTEIVRDENGKPTVSRVSPLKQYGLMVNQFSITETEFDKVTLTQFATKKEAFLKAEQSKVLKEQEVQQRLMVIEKGLREKAEVEAISNKERAQAVIQAQKEKEMAEITGAQKVAVAELEKKKAETEAQQKVSVAEQQKKEAEVVAQRDFEVAKLQNQAATEKAAAIVTLAKAEQEKIKLGGAITEEKRVLAQITADRDVKVAEALKDVKTPQVVFYGSQSGTAGGTSNTTQDLMNLSLLKSNGLLK